MTLVEVLAGLALLAALLGAVLLATGRYARQSAAAARRLQAVAAADALLAGWHLNPRSLPRAGGGAAAGDVGLTWRTTPLAGTGVDELGGRAVRLEVLDDRTFPPPVLVGVEFVVPEEPASKAPATETAATLPSSAARQQDRSSGNVLRFK